MRAVCIDLENTLSRLEPETAAMLERLVRDSLSLAERCRSSIPREDARGWPAGYFDRTEGSFAGEPFETPPDPPGDPVPRW